MNRIFHSSANAVLFRLTNNAEHYKNENGTFKVTSHKKRPKSFPTLCEAFIFYMLLEEEAELWDISKGSTLVEKKVKMYLN